MPYNPYNPYAQTAMPQYNMPLQQSQVTTFINVPSEEAARRWEVSPNSTLKFINENDGFIYIKSVGMSILEPPVFEIYRTEKISDNREQVQKQPIVEPDMSAYMTKSEFEAYKTIIDDMQKIVKELNGDG